MLALNPIWFNFSIATFFASSSVIFSFLLSSVIFVNSSLSPEDNWIFSGVFQTFSTTLLPANATPVLNNIPIIAVATVLKIFFV